MRELRASFCRERDPAARQEIFDRLFLLMAARCRKLVELIPEERDSERLNAMIVELNAIVQERRKAIELLFETTQAERQTDPSPSQETPPVTVLHKTASSSGS